MSNIDVTTILRRLQTIRRYLKRLQRFESVTQQEYLDSIDNQLIAERLIQISIEATIDINKHILTELGVLQQQEAWRNKDYFIAMFEHNILSREVAQQLAQAVGMRNILVHQYLEINPVIIYEAIPKCLNYLPKYVNQISTYLTTLDTDSL